ncbi:unnamed protein product [Protopolystoma xenopodis]|uniref:Uncharacterized protein n=1 Tax=Protopolystoma xenopodis TaxID=117903 RepID=A0A3S5A6D5_9PLAT|nr:unnamed protein product [Protopolystoma xenopodis]
MYSPFGGLIWLLCRRRPGWVQELSENNKKRHTKGSIRSPKRRLRDKLNGEVDIKDIFYTKQTWNDDIEAINMPEERDGEEAPAEEDDEVEYSTTTIRLALEGVELTANFDLLDHLKSDQQSYAGTRADVRRASSWLAQSLIWPRRQRRLRAPWATVSGESLVLAVPSRAVAQLTRPQRALQWMDAGISEVSDRA